MPEIYGLILTSKSNAVYMEILFLVELTPLATGTTGMVINGNWLAATYDQSMTEYNYGVTYMPRDKAAASDMGGNALAVLNKAKNPEQALKFIQFMT